MLRPALPSGRTTAVTSTHLIPVIAHWIAPPERNSVVVWRSEDLSNNGCAPGIDAAMMMTLSSVLLCVILLALGHDIATTHAFQYIRGTSSPNRLISDRRQSTAVSAYR